MAGRLARISLYALLLTAFAAFAAVDPVRLDVLKARNIGPAGMSGRIAAIDAFAPDPRSKDTAADWVERAGDLLEKAADAAIRIRRTRDELAALEERLRRENETLRDPDERRRANETPFAREAAALKLALTEMENLLWSPPEAAGISARDRVAQDLQASAGSVASSWAPPGPTHFERLHQAEARRTKYLADLDGFCARSVAALREKAAAEGVGLMAPRRSGPGGPART